MADKERKLKKGKKKVQNLNIFRKKNFLNEIKSIFYNF